MKKLAHILTVTALFATLTPALLAQQPTASPTPAAGQQQESDADAKRRLYTCYYNNFSSNPTEAYRCSQEYIQRFGSENDQYVTAIRQFITTHEANVLAEQDNAVYRAIDARQYAEALQLGRARMIANPNNLRMMVNLALAGLQVAIANPNTPASTTAEAIGYGTRAIQLIESGRTPGEGAEAWRPFTSRDETLGWMNYAIGTMNLRTNPTEAANRLRRAAQFEGSAKLQPTTYGYLAFAYRAGEYERLREDYQTRFPAGSTESPESQAALATLNGVIDRIMDAYARAINASNATPEFQQAYQQQRTEWTTALTELFRFRNNNSDAGLQAFITGAASRPLPQPGDAPASTTPTTTTTTTPTPTTGGTATQPATTTTQPTTTTPNTNATPTAPTTTRPATSMPTTRPATTTPTTQPATRPSSQQPTTATPRTTTRPAASPSPTTRP